VEICVICGYKKGPKEIRMKILVTGGLGFIGSNFVRFMVDNAEIVVVDASN